MTSSGRALLIVVVVSAGLATFVASRFMQYGSTPGVVTVATAPRPDPPPLQPATRPVAPAQAAPGPVVQSQVVQSQVVQSQVVATLPSQAVPAQAAPSPVTVPQPPAAAAIPQPDPPRFDVVRVGARGGVVVAGRAAPGAEVILLEDGRELGRARADGRGDWVILPVEPLRPGNRQLSLRASLGGVEVAGAEMAVVLVPQPTLVAEAARNDGAEAAARAEALLRAQAAEQIARAASAEQAAGAASAEQASRTEALAAAQATRPAEDAARAAAAEQAARGAATRRLDEAVQAAQQAALAAEADALAAEARAAQLARAAQDSRPLVVLLPASEAAAPRILQGGGPKSGAVAALGLDVVDYDTAGSIRFAGTAPPNTAIRIYVNDSHAGDAQADAQGRWAMVPPVAPEIGRHRLRVDQLAANGAVSARIELPFQRDEITPASVAEGRVVVQPGNNLWRLARAAYGSGVRYTTLFQANRDQIRNPDLIFPGQVFAVPAHIPADSSRSR